MPRGVSVSADFLSGLELTLRAFVRRVSVSFTASPAKRAENGAEEFPLIL